MMCKQCADRWPVAMCTQRMVGRCQIEQAAGSSSGLAKSCNAANASSFCCSQSNLTRSLQCSPQRTLEANRGTSQTRNLHQYVTTLMAKSALRRFACTFGSGDFGRLVHGSNAPELLPRIVAQLADSNVRQAAAGGAHTVIVTGKHI